MLRLCRIKKDWKEFKLRNISLDVKSGEYFILLGPSGSGKTLLLEVIAGIHKPDEGKIYLDGEDITEKPPEKRNIAYVPQNYALFPHLSVYENISYGLKLRKLDKKEIDEIVKNLAHSLGISHLLHRKPITLSGGEQQRVAIARALAIKPKILLLDEPFSNLDVGTRSKLIRDMKRWHEEFKFTAIHVTHSFDEAMSLGERVGVMIDGRIEEVGNLKEVFSTPKNVKVAEFLGYNILYGEKIKDLKLSFDSKYVVIKPEDISISEDGIEAIVEHVELLKFSANVILNVNGLKLKALTTVDEILKNNIEVGSKVFVRIRNFFTAGDSASTFTTNVCKESVNS